MIHLLDWLKTRLAAVRADALRLGRWARRSGPFYAGSAAAHVLAVIVVIAWTVREEVVADSAQPDEIDTEIKEPEVARFIIGTPPVRISELSTRSLAMTQPPAQAAKRFDDAPLFEDAGGGTRQSGDEPALGGLGGFVGDETGTSIALGTKSGVGIGLGTSELPGNGGPDEGFAGAGKGERQQFDGGAEEETERAVAAALNWLRRHQHDDGSWSLTGFACHCQGETCTGACDTKDDVLATALCVLPFLMSGQSHTGEGPYQRSLARTIDWLLAQQAADGGFSSFSPNGAPTHAIATLCMCEAYAMTGDARLEDAAGRALRFLEQHLLTIDGWQWAALSSAQHAGLSIDEAAAREASDWHASQYVKTFRSAPSSETRSELASVVMPLDVFFSSPEDQPSSDDVVQCFASIDGSDRHAWNQRHEPIRRRLLGTQIKTGCATGSWSAESANAAWLPHQGRLPTTCFAAILLAASYRHLPMHKSPVLPLARQPQETRHE